jgi:hypothetical protein
MKNKGITELKEAPGYGISEAGDVVSIKSGKTVTPTKGSVRLTVNKKRVTFKLIDLQSLYKLIKEGAEVLSEPKEEVAAVVDKPKKKFNSRKVNEEDRELEAKTLKEAGLTSGAVLIRVEFAKNPEAFDIEKFSIKTGIKMSRIKGCIKLYSLKLKKTDK